jgi:hypothetical protein
LIHPWKGDPTQYQFGSGHGRRRRFGVHPGGAGALLQVPGAAGDSSTCRCGRGGSTTRGSPTGRGTVGYVPQGGTRQQHAYQASRSTIIGFRDAWFCKGTDPAACPLSEAPNPRHVQPEPGSRPRTCSTKRNRWWTCAQSAAVRVLLSTHQLHHPIDTSTSRPVRNLHGLVSAYATPTATRDEVVRVRSGSCTSSTTCGTLWSSSAAIVYRSWLRTV